MQITAIKPVGRSKCAIYADGSFYANVSVEVVKYLKLKIGQEIGEQELQDLIHNANLKAAKEKAFTLLSYRDHSKKELIDKIARTIGKDSAVWAAQEMEQLRLIDDTSFAQKLAFELFNKRLYPEKRVRHELFKRGIQSELVDQVISQLAPEPQWQIRKLIEKKYSNRLGSKKDIERTAAALSRCGFSYDDIKAVLGEYINEDWY